MPRSATVWAAALVLASFSGSGPLLTTAEAMPAPGPQQTQGRPRYYFPRHVKRQIVTNTTAPAAPTTSPASSSSTSEQLQSRQPDFLSSLMGILDPKVDESSNVIVSKSDSETRASTVTSIQEIVVTPVPELSEPLSGTGNLRPSPAPMSPEPVEERPPPVAAPSTSAPAFVPRPQDPESEAPEVVPSSPVRGPSSSGVPPVVLQPTPSPEPVPELEPEPVATSSAVRVPLLDPLLGSTGLIPEIIVPATSTTPTSAAGPSTSAPAVVVQPTPTPSASAPAGGLLSSLLAPIVAPTSSAPAVIVQPSVLDPIVAPTGSAPAVIVQPSVLDPIVAPTGSAPAVVVQPTPTPQVPVSSDESGQRVGSTGPVPEIIVPASSAPVALPEPSSPAASSFQGPFIVPGSTGGGIPSSVVQPTQSQGLVGGLLSTLLGVPEATPTADIGSTGVLPTSIALPTPAPASPSSEQPPVVQPSSGGIVVGITTALGTGASSPTPVGSGAIPTSEAVLPSGPLDLPSILSSLVSEVTGVQPPGSAGPTPPVSESPVPTASGVLPPLVSSLVSDVSSLLPSAVPEIPVSVFPSIISSLVSDLPPSATVPAALPPASSIVSSIASDISSGLVPSGIIPSGVSTPSGAVPTTSESLITPLLPSETPTVPPSAVLSGTTPPIETSSGVLPSGIPSSGVSSAPTVTPSPTESSGVPASESPASTVSPVAPSSASVAPPSSGNATISETPTFVIPTTSAPASDSASVVAPSTTPAPTSKPAPVQSQKPIGSDSATSMVVGTSIIQETTSNAAPSPTSSGIPSSLPKMIAPPGGVVSGATGDDFLGQVCFKWPLNYPFVSANDGGNQIFHYLPKAVADGLNISVSDVRNVGLRPLDTTAYQGFITTLALFTIPKDLQSKLAAQLRNPADPFWRNKDQTVNDLTNLINTACPLPAGKLPGDNSSPNQAANPAATATGGSGDGGALGGDINSSRPVNASAAGIATGAIVGAIAYGAAMFFVARRYRNKRIAHQRSSSVPSTGSRMTYGSIPGGAAAWMHGARNGRITPGSRGSQGSSSTQGRSVRTQQISAPVMAENSLGWN